MASSATAIFTVRLVMRIQSDLLVDLLDNPHIPSTRLADVNGKPLPASYLSLSDPCFSWPHLPLETARSTDVRWDKCRHLANPDSWLRACTILSLWPADYGETAHQ